MTTTILVPLTEEQMEALDPVLMGSTDGDHIKTCTKCNSTKPLAEFHANRKMRDGLQCWCKACRSSHAKATHDPDAHRAYRAQNAHAIRVRKQAYFAANREKEQARSERWGKANPDRARAIKRRHAEQHGDRDIKRLQQFIAEHPDRKNMGRKELRDPYVAYVMARRSKLLEPTDIPQGLIDAKREQLRILRELRKEDHEER
jgi:hypothetical protein